MKDLETMPTVWSGSGQALSSIMVIIVDKNNVSIIILEHQTRSREIPQSIPAELDSDLIKSNGA